MAQLVVAAAGAAIGGMIAPGVVAFGMTGAAMGWMAGSVVGSMFAPSQKSEGPRLGDLSVSGSSYGTPIPWVVGSPRIGGQVIWASEAREIANTQHQGKGGAGADYTSYTYEVDLLIKLTDNIMAAVPQVWRNGELVYSILVDADPATVDASINAGLWSRMTVYTGAPDQLPDPDYEAAVGTANAPAYRGCCTMFIKSLQLGNSKQVPNLTSRVAQHATSGVSGSGTVGWSDNPVYSESSTPNEWDGSGNTRLVFMPSLNRWAFWKTVGSTGGSNGTQTYMHATADGSTWSENVCTSVISSQNAMSDMAYGLGKYVVTWVDANGTPVMPKTTPDGLTWTACTVSDASNGARIRAVAFNGTFFISIGAGYGESGTYVYKSTDGQLWVPLTTLSTVSLLSILWDGSNFVAVGGKSFGSSADGASWTTGNISTSGHTSWNPYVCGSSSILAVAEKNSVIGDLRFSTNHGLSWGQSSFNWSIYRIYSLWFDGSHFNVICTSLDRTVSYIASSLNCVDWVIGNLDELWIGERTLPAANGLGKSVAITQTYSRTPKRTLIYKFDSSGTVTIVDPTLPDVVADLMLLAGYTTNQFDVSALPTTKVVRALANSSVSTARTVLAMLGQVYHFDAVLNRKLCFRPRGGAPVATLAYDELGMTANGQAGGDPFPLSTGLELEIPAQMAVTYNNVNNDYLTDTQLSDRLLTGMQSLSTVNLPMGFTPAEAKAIADALLYDKYVSYLSVTITLDMSHAAIEPLDVLIVTDKDGSTYRMRVVKKSVANGVISLNLVGDDASVFVQGGITDSSNHAQTTVLPVASTTLVLLDLPLLRDADDIPGLYVAVTGGAANWASAAVYDSLDDVSYTQRQVITSQAALGTCTTALGDWTGGNIFDETNTVTVDVGPRLQLESVGWDDILANQALNAAVFGNEVGQFRVATLVSAGVYILSGLLRGRRGTEDAMTGHVAGERFVLLGSTGLSFLALQSSDLARERFYKGVSAGQALSAVTAQAITPLGNTLKPFAPVHTLANRDAADTVISWVRSTRLSTRVVGPLPMSVPLGEAVEAYEVEVWSSGYSTLKRTLTSNTPSATYTAAQQVADFGSVQGTLYLKIYQLSATVGRGKPFIGSV